MSNVDIEEEKNKAFGNGMCCAAILTGFVWLVLIVVLSSCQETGYRNDAVKAGHAEYYLDANNERQWRWKDQTK